MPVPSYFCAVCSLYFYALLPVGRCYSQVSGSHLIKAFLSPCVLVSHLYPHVPSPKAQQFLSPPTTLHIKHHLFFLTDINSEGQTSTSSKLIVSQAFAHAPANMRFVHPPPPLAPREQGSLSEAFFCVLPTVMANITLAQLLPRLAGS